ncbi:hypothetical protein ACFY8C_38575 [Streptomyces flavochromogenes]|uniref:Uncharacterized protein n=1 Tax=Streptomyces flavochromogenes TaxID=68199 RepID=A0ABW6Y339_9ACTN
MDAATIMVIAPLVTAHLCALVGLWLRFRWRARLEEERARYLAKTVTRLVVPGAQVDLDDQHAAGHRLRVRVTAAPSHDIGRAA